MAVVMGGIQGGAMKRLSARFGERSLIVGGGALLALGFAALAPAPSVLVLVVPLALCAIGRAVLQPSLMSLASVAAGADQRGAVMGAFQSSASLARVVGPVAAGLLYDWSQAAPFFLAAALAAWVAFEGRSLPEAATGVVGGEAFAPPGA